MLGTSLPAPFCKSPLSLTLHSPNIIIVRAAETSSRMDEQFIKFLYQNHAGDNVNVKITPGSGSGDCPEGHDPEYTARRRRAGSGCEDTRQIDYYQRVAAGRSHQAAGVLYPIQPIRA